MRSSKLELAMQAPENTLTVNLVLRKTYLLLSLTLILSAVTAAYATITHAAPSLPIMLIGMFGFYFLTIALRNSSWGVLAIFAYSSFMGYTLGPVLNLFLHNYANGAELIATAFGATGVIFLGMSAYALISRKNFSYLGGFIAVTSMVLFMAGLLGVFFNMPVFQLLISGGFAVISAAFILFTTNQIINGGERNYIMATISLYIAFFNLFVSLLRIFGAFAGNSRN